MSRVFGLVLVNPGIAENPRLETFRGASYAMPGGTPGRGTPAPWCVGTISRKFPGRASDLKRRPLGLWAPVAVFLYLAPAYASAHPSAMRLSPDRPARPTPAWRLPSRTLLGGGCAFLTSG